MELARYEEARHALQACATVDEAKNIMDKTAALSAYARQVNDKDMECWLAEMKMRAMRRVGELTSEIKTTQGARNELSTSGGTKSKTEQLKAAGLTKQTVGRYEKLAKVPEDEFETVINAAKKKTESVTFASFDRPEKAKENKKARTESINEISKGNEQLNTSKKYPVIYADPPWQYNHSETDSRKIENHYPTMSLNDICDMPVNDLAAKDSILFLWTTSPKLEDGLKVLNSWGFKYTTCAVWDKQKKGLGYYFRQNHELLLIGKKGSIPTPDPENRPDSVVSIPKSNHSAKPTEFHKIIERMYPEFSRIELFCRKPQKKWEVWGNQKNG